MDEARDSETTRLRLADALVTLAELRLEFCELCLAQGTAAQGARRTCAESHAMRVRLMLQRERA